MADSHDFWVIVAKGFHPFPSRTRKLSPSAPMVLHAQVCGRVGRCPINKKPRLGVEPEPGFYFCRTKAGSDRFTGRPPDMSPEAEVRLSSFPSKLRSSR